MEFALIEGQVAAVGSATAARALGSLPSWIATNGSVGATG